MFKILHATLCEFECKTSSACVCFWVFASFSCPFCYAFLVLEVKGKVIKQYNIIFFTFFRLSKLYIKQLTTFWDLSSENISYIDVFVQKYNYLSMMYISDSGAICCWRKKGLGICKQQKLNKIERHLVYSSFLHTNKTRQAWHE